MISAQPYITNTDYDCHVDQSDDEHEQDNAEEQSGGSEEEEDNERDDSGQVDSDGDHQEEEDEEDAHETTGKLFTVVSKKEKDFCNRVKYYLQRAIAYF